MNRSIKTEAPHKNAVSERLHEYLEIRRTMPISIVDVIAWFCAAASLIATLCSMYIGYGS